ncbi:hypothetical protein HYC85_021636 [Camellia sinensis]|uniref:acetyl-CoA carboxytransferase n=1 Tax=Camellia sinensis TaxID=4442 RepID=A0A7J7GI69_CAMSI|nr:hypothetical protein HYC85_021636 [Camellia sinensis]
MDLQKKIIDVQKMANETGLDFSDQIILLENKYHQALKDLYTHLIPIQRVNIARHPNRPTFLDHFVELHGDRAGYDDPAIVTGLGTINGRSYMFMGHQKGRNTKENIQRNFGMPTPHGYRKAMRMMYYADHHGFPVVTFIDTPEAFADLKSEELGQGEAIAHNLRTMFGGSGGALAIGCANKLLMLENAVFYVARYIRMDIDNNIYEYRCEGRSAKDERERDRDEREKRSKGSNRSIDRSRLRSRGRERKRERERVVWGCSAVRSTDGASIFDWIDRMELRLDGASTGSFDQFHNPLESHPNYNGIFPEKEDSHWNIVSMARIGGGVFPVIKGPNYLVNGEYRVDKGAAPKMLNCLIKISAKLQSTDDLTRNFANTNKFQQVVQRHK